MREVCKNLFRQPSVSLDAIWKKIATCNILLPSKCWEMLDVESLKLLLLSFLCLSSLFFSCYHLEWLIACDISGVYISITHSFNSFPQAFLFEVRVKVHSKTAHDLKYLFQFVQHHIKWWMPLCFWFELFTFFHSFRSVVLDKII